MPIQPPTSRELQRQKIDFGDGPEASVQASLLADLGIPWPNGLAPTPAPLDDPPSINSPLPKADYLVVTWTVAELEALADTLTPGVSRRDWYRYARHFDLYKPDIREGAPSLKVNRLGSYFVTKIGEKSVVCFKSELHMNQDGVEREEGNATHPVKRLFEQLIAECQASLVITVGTAGATYPEHFLGDVMITRAARFRCAREFKNAPYNRSTYRSEFAIPTKHFATARKLLRRQDAKLVEPDFGPPTGHYPWTGPLLPGTRNQPDLRVDGEDLPAFHPILTTDFFEFGTTTNGLEKEGCGVEMGDAVLGLVAEEMGAAAPRWLVIRNASDPAINGHLPEGPRATNMQAHWAVWYYEAYGYWTSVNSAIATWAVIAGDE